ncbi:hypothetical protein BUALT_Bualt12G0146800 [Buddleja alternifolia]|uniref:Uncharacterized protein n=1 Tax=Buddleja alternifolia TaxID=168488 RepID=A0AAV6WWC2_9LAMI|nr:hypothetical protein BUALT_Bualt12G0146800 [Buddleja alternifolia]
MVRSSCVDKNGLRKGLARCGKSCRLRWMNYLKPGIKRGTYSKEEEDLIAKLHHELGNKWSAIAAKLPGRTDNEIKNYWHTHLKNGSKRKSSVMSSDVLIFQNQEQNNISNNENMISRHLKNSSSNSNSGNLENLEASSSDHHHIHILESSSSKSCCNINNPSTTSCTSLNWNSADSTTNSTSTSPRTSANYYSYTTTTTTTTQQQQQQQLLQKSSCFLSYDDQPAAAALLPSQTTDSTQLQNIIQGDDIFCGGMINSRATHDPSDITFGGFGDSFWTQPFLVDTQIDCNYNDNFSLLDDDQDASFIFTNSSNI